MKRPFLCVNPFDTLLCLVLACSFASAEAQIAPGAPTKEYIRLADRLIAIEHTPQPGALPVGLSSTPIASSCSLNGVSFAGGQFSVTGTGLNGLAGTADAFEFASIPVTGDVTMIARIPSVPTGPLAANAAVGLMLRTDLTASSPYALIGIGRHSTFQSLLATFRPRSATGGVPAYHYGLAFVPSYWFKLVRSGNTITGHTSGNGVDWVQLGPALTTITAPTIYAGLAVANATSNCTSGTVLSAALDHFVLSTGPGFYLTTSPAAVSSSAAGEINSYSVGVNPLYGFANPVSFTVAGLPSGVSWMFNPATVTPAGGTILTVTAPPGTQPGGYPFTIHSSGGGKTHTDYATFTVSIPASGGLAAGWRTASINNCSLNAAASANGVFTVTGGGGDLANTLDGFQFVYAPVTGDMTLIARILGPLSGSALLVGGGAGLMLRAGLSVYDAYAFIGVGRPSPSVAVYQTVFRKRASTGQYPAAPAFGTTFHYGSFYGPYWFKLVRSGSSIAGYTSINGVDWVFLGTPLTGITSATMYVGLAVTSGNAACSAPNLITASFDSLVLLGGSGEGAPDFSIGVPSDVPNVSTGGSLSVTTAVAAAGGFSEEVELSVSDLPDGAEGFFDPAALEGQGTSALTIATSSSLSMPGSYSPTITGDSSSLSRSATLTFIVDPPPSQPPTALLSPASGSGVTQMFSLTADEPSGAGNIQWVQFLVNDTLSGIRACYLHYDVSSNELYLRDDADPSWAASKQLGTAGTIANSQCSIDTGVSSFAASGGSTATLNLAVTFKAPFAGEKTVYGLVDSGNWNSGWEELGTWSVPVPSGSLPSGWTNWAVDNSCSLNTATHTAGVFTVSGVGGGLGGTIDSLRFPSIAVTGNVTIIGRIPSALAGYLNHLSGGGVGLMLRKGPTAASPYAFIGISRSGFGPVQVMFRGRVTENTNASTPVWGPGFTAPYWFKLHRSGDTITGYTSPDGSSWTSRGSITIPAATTMYAGLVVIQGGGTVCSATYNLTAAFDNVSITNP